MKNGLHPLYHPNATVTCACGNTFTIGSTKPEIRVEICAACHPFYTGQKKLVDTRGRVERFEKITQKSAAEKAKRAALKAAPRTRKNIALLSERQWKRLKIG